MNEVNKFYIKIYLVVCSKEPTKFLVRLTPDGKYEFPSNFLTKENPDTKAIAASLLFDLIGVSEGWAALPSFGIPPIIIVDNTIPVLYGCFIPEPVRIKLSGEEYVWIEYNELKSNIVSPLTLSLCHEVIYKRI